MTYRALGWAYLSTDTVTSYHFGDIDDTSVHNSTYQSSSTSYNTDVTSFVNDAGSYAMKFYSSGGKVRIIYSAACASNNAQLVSIGKMIDGSDIAETLRDIGTPNNTTTERVIGYTQWQGVLARGIHTIQGRFLAPANTAYVNSRSIIIEEI